MDISLNDENEICFEGDVLLTFSNPETNNDEQQSTHIRFLVKRTDGTIESTRIELSTDSNLFFFYISEYTSETFNQLKVAQNLDPDLDFESFPEMIRDILINSEENGDYETTFVFEDEEKGTLKLTQKLKFKKVEIFSLEFIKASDEEITNQVQFRYNQARAELKAAKTELSDLYAMLKIKNPSVLKQMKPKK